MLNHHVVNFTMNFHPLLTGDESKVPREYKFQMVDYVPEEGTLIRATYIAC